jgi:hypothetical protein
MRVLLVSEAADEVEARAFGTALSYAMPDATLDHFSPSFSFGSVPAWLVQETKSRLDAADAIVCLLGTTSIASAWATWSITAALDTSKRIGCVRLHSNSARDVPPPIVGARRVPVLDADPSLLVKFLVDGSIPLERTRRLEPQISTPLRSRFGERG